MPVPSFSTAVRDRLVAGWTAAPVALRNHAWFLPSDPLNDRATYDPDRFPDAPWAMVLIDDFGFAPGPVGSSGKRLAVRSGLLWLHVFVPIGTGERLLEPLETELSALFAGVAFGGIAGGVPQPGGDGPGDEAGLWFRSSRSVSLTSHFAI